MNTNRLKLLGGVLALVVAFAGVIPAGATLTMDATSITGSGNVTVNGVPASVYTIGTSTTTGTIAIGGTAQTGAITIGDTAASTVSEISIGGGNGIKTINIGDGTGANTILIGGGAGTVTVNAPFVLSGSVATGLSMTGTVTNGIDLTGATLTQNVDNALFSIGSISAAKVLPAITANYVPMQVNLESQINPGSALSLIGGYFKVANSTVDQANLQLVGIAPRVSMGKNATDAYGVQSHLTLVSGAQSTGNMTAVSGKTILGGATTGGIVSAGLFTIEGNTVATATSTGYGVWADITNGAQVSSIFMGNVNDANSSATIGLALNGAITTGIDLDGITGGGTDIKLQNAEIISNAVDGTISFGAANLATTGAGDFSGASALKVPTGVGLENATCVAGLKGSIYYATSTLGAMTADKIYVCDGAAHWVVMN